MSLHSEKLTKKTKSCFTYFGKLRNLKNLKQEAHWL